jgi:hypothetical protein
MKGLKKVVAIARGAILIRPLNDPSYSAPRLKLEAASSLPFFCSIAAFKLEILEVKSSTA